MSRDRAVPARVSQGLVLSVVVGVAAVLTGAAVSGGWGAAFLVLVVVAWLTWTYPQVLPAILLVGPGFLHLLTYVSGGFAVRGDVLASPLKFVPLLLALFGAVIVKAMFVEGTAFRQRVVARGSPGRWLLSGVAVLLMLLAVGTLNSPSPIYGATKTLGFAAFSVFPVVLILLTARERSYADRVLNAIVIIGGSWLLLALVLAISQGNLDLYRADPGELLGGTNQSGGGLGTRAGIVAIAAVSSALHHRRFRVAKVGIATTAVAMVVLSGHRASVLAFAAGMTVLLLALWIGPSGIVKGARIFVVGLIMFAGIWWGWANAPTEVRERFVDPFHSTSYQNRLDVQVSALTAWRKAPIFGNGTGSSAYFIASADQPAFGVVNGIYPHNVTVELLAELGVVGAAIFLATIIGLLWRALVHLRSQDRQPAVVALFSMVTLAFVEAQGWADLTIQNDLWILSALLAVALTRSSSDDVAPPSGIARRSVTRLLV